MSLPHGLDHKKLAECIDWSITHRRTEKVLAVEPLRPRVDQFQEIQTTDDVIRESVEVAGWAPFHYDRRKDNLAEPWRAYMLFLDDCRVLAEKFPGLVPDLKPGNKIPKMLNACGALVLINWIPEKGLDNPKLKSINEEHLAASSAMVQNLLLALHSRGLGTYWSSGGLLGGSEIFEFLKIDAGEQLIAAVFVDYPFLTNDAAVERIPGKNREKRSHFEAWSREIKID